MSLENFIEQQIQKAIANGEFDNLEGAGRPLDLDAYFATPEDLRMGYSVLKSAKIVPEEVDRLKEIGELKEQIRACGDDEKKRALIKLCSERKLALNLILERNKRSRNSGL
jgi:Domain of unknown function (DUF1992)